MQIFPNKSKTCSSRAEATRLQTDADPPNQMLICKFHIVAASRGRGSYFAILTLFASFPNKLRLVLPEPERLGYRQTLILQTKRQRKFHPVLSRRRPERRRRKLHPLGAVTCVTASHKYKIKSLPIQIFGFLLHEHKSFTCCNSLKIYMLKYHICRQVLFIVGN